jgi:Fic family protein
MTGSFEPKFTITNAITRDLTHIERARGFLQAATLSDSWINEMSERALLLEAHHTTHIEGTQLTLVQSEQLLAGKAVKGVAADDARELLNYRDAFELVSAYLLEGAPITESLIREIHARLVSGVRGNEGQPGEYRRIQNAVVNSETGEVIYTPPHANDVPALMAKLVTWLNQDSDIHPVLVAALAQFQLVHVHPFVDGNGRTSRLLSTLCLYRSGYDFKRLFTISEYYDRDRRTFYDSIQAVRNNEMDYTVWLEFFTRGLATQLNETVERGTLVIRADLAVQEHGLSSRQAKILRRLFEAGRLNIQEAEKICPDVTRRTLQRDLSLLEEKGLLERTGETNQHEYVARKP